MAESGSALYRTRAGEDGPAALLRVRLRYGSESRSRIAHRVGKVPGPDTDFEPEIGASGLDLDFSLTARRNVLFGASGSGKTTILRLLAGLLEPSEGLIQLGSVTLTDTARRVALPAGRRDIGYVTQTPALFPHLTVEANLAYGLHGRSGAQHRSLDQRRGRVAELIELFSLASLARRTPVRLSGGERHRVALARALAPAPALLLLDEPFTGLDAELREQTVAALERALAAAPATVFSVSHDVAEVYAGGAEVLLLEGGRIQRLGPAKEVLAGHRERLLRLLGGQSAIL